MAKLNLKPLDDRIVIQQSEAEERTAGGIVLPDTAKEKPQRGKMSVKAGDEVFYGKYAGSDVEVNGTKYVIMKETEVLAIIEKD